MDEKIAGIEFRKKYSDKCKKCKPWLFCRKHQILWHKVVIQSPVPLKLDAEAKENLQKFVDSIGYVLWRKK